MLQKLVLVILYLDVASKFRSPLNRFLESMRDDDRLVYSGVFHEIPSEKTLGPAEWCIEFGCVLRRSIYGWFYYFPETAKEKARLYFRPAPGRQLDLESLRKVLREWESEETPELRAMLYFAEYDAGM